MNNNGWIKLHRKMLDNPISRKPAWLSLWVTLLLLANHDNRNKFIWMGKEMEQKAGEFVTGRKALSEKTGIPESTVEDILSFLENSCQIRQQKTTKYRLITIVKWNEYQEPDNKATTKQQQSDTIKKLRNKEYKNKSQSEAEASGEEKQKTFIQGKEWNELIDSFADVNPMYTQFYKLPHQRKALDELARSIGVEKLKNTIRALKDITSRPYAPKITSPTELKRDLGKLVAFYNQEKNKNKEGPKFSSPNYVL